MKKFKLVVAVIAIAIAAAGLRQTKNQNPDQPAEQDLVRPLKKENMIRDMDYLPGAVILYLLTNQ